MIYLGAFLAAVSQITPDDLAKIKTIYKKCMIINDDIRNKYGNVVNDPNCANVPDIMKVEVTLKFRDIIDECKDVPTICSYMGYMPTFLKMHGYDQAQSEEIASVLESLVDKMKTIVGIEQPVKQTGGRAESYRVPGLSEMVSKVIMPSDPKRD